MTPEQVRWGLENLELRRRAPERTGFAQDIRPSRPAATNHPGRLIRIATWDGAVQGDLHDWYQVRQVHGSIRLYRNTREKYAKEKTSSENAYLGRFTIRSLACTQGTTRRICLMS